MKKLIAVLLFAIILSACAPALTPTPVPPTKPAVPTAAPSPTAARTPLPPTKPAVPTAAPSPTAARTPLPPPPVLPTKPAVPTAAPSPTAARTPLPPRSPIALLDVKHVKQPDGNIRTTANVMAAETLGLGQMDLAHPETMLVGETGTIRLRISPAQQLVALPTVAAPAKTPDLPAFVYKFKGNVEVYPLMFAELRTLSFDFDPKGRVRRTVEAGKTVEWVWVVRPSIAGRHELSIELSIPTIVNGVPSELNTDVLQNVPVVIQAQERPRPLAEVIAESIAQNAGAIIVALIGLLGTIIGIVVKLRSDSKGRR